MQIEDKRCTHNSTSLDMHFSTASSFYSSHRLPSFLASSTLVSGILSQMNARWGSNMCGISYRCMVLFPFWPIPMYVIILTFNNRWNHSVLGGGISRNKMTDEPHAHTCGKNMYSSYWMLPCRWSINEAFVKERESVCVRSWAHMFYRTGWLLRPQLQ